MKTNMAIVSRINIQYEVQAGMKNVQYQHQQTEAKSNNENLIYGGGKESQKKGKEMNH